MKLSAGSADSSLPGPPTETEDESVGHVSRGEQKAQTASQKSPGTASACEGLIELGNCDGVPRNSLYTRDILYFALFDQLPVSYCCSCHGYRLYLVRKYTGTPYTVLL